MQPHLTHGSVALIAGFALAFSACHTRPDPQPPTHANSAPAPAALPAESAGRESAAAALAPHWLRDPLRAAFDRAGARRTEWVECVLAAPTDMREDVCFLVAHMPRVDLASLDRSFVIENVRLAREAWRDAPWGGFRPTNHRGEGTTWTDSIPDEVYRNAVLPYANLNEKRENWRAEFAVRVRPLIAGCKTPGEAALAINAKLFDLVKVQYHATKTPKPDQSPSESITARYASCTGLSILLVDACRAVGIPARTVGTPQWVIPKGDANGNHGGNHTWVEIWDGQWHVLGAAEVSPLDQVWFSGNAAMAIGRAGERRHGIYAAVWEPRGSMTNAGDPPSAGSVEMTTSATASLTNDATRGEIRHSTKTLTFPLVWDETIDWVNAEDVTASYADRREVTVSVVDVSVRSRGKATAHRLVFRQNGRLIADVAVMGARSLMLSGGQKYEVDVFEIGDTAERIDHHPKFSHRTIMVPKEVGAGVVVEVGR